jgi:HNH endonuclease
MDELEAILAENGRSYRDREPDPDMNWYPFCRTVTSDGKMEIGCQTEFVGFSENRPFRERRQASCVHPHIWREHMSELREVPLTVQDDSSFLVWLIIGGEVLVEESVARRNMPQELEPYEVGRIATEFGWHCTKSLAASALRHAPSPKLRAEVLLRDNRRCCLCGRSPDEDPHAFLEAHHGIPWGDRRSGLTVKENLFTLCNTCHRGVTDGLELQLMQSLDVNQAPDPNGRRTEYLEGVVRYRKRVVQFLNETKRRPSRRP